MDIVKFEVEVDCPGCGFSNPIWLRQAELRDVIICRGCKANIQLDDSMNTVRKGVRSVHRALHRSHEQIQRHQPSIEVRTVQDAFVQAIRYKLQKRARRLNSADYQHFPMLLRVFFHYFDNSPILSGVRDELMARAVEQDIPATVDRILKGEALYGTTEAESAAMGYHVLTKIAEEPDNNNLVMRIGYNYNATGNAQECLEAIRDVLLEPFYEYIDEHLDDQQAILYFLRRYKHRCEWFHADRLRKALEGNTQRGEKGLASDLYEYLHDQGIDFHIESNSASGIPDFVADQVGKDRIIADAKLFWPERSKGKSYIISGFHQAYTYACDFNEPCAFLVIYKMCGEAVNFLVPSTDSWFPSLTVNNKTIFFVVVDIFEHGASASKRGPMKSIGITEQELVQRVELKEDLPEAEPGLNAVDPEQS